MVDSYEKRLEMARRELVEAIRRRDEQYPGSPVWQREQVKVQEWEQLIRDLHAAGA